MNVSAYVFALLVAASAVLAAIHVVMTKDDVRAAIAWLGFVLFVPFFGALFYVMFGVNRIRRRARHSRLKQGLHARSSNPKPFEGPQLEDLVPEMPEHWSGHALLSGRIAEQPLSTGNIVEPLTSARSAYDAMVDAINGAQESIALTTYIFQADQAGRRFLTALRKAHERGVAVRVLVDSIGNLYGLRPVMRLLKKQGVPVASFNPPSISWRMAFFNLRTHRKILVVDRLTGFAGGMNIRASHLTGPDGRAKMKDTHFRITGPLVAQLIDAFADDWLYSSGEDLIGPLWYEKCPCEEDGHVTARAVADGPDETHHKTALILASALGCARRHVRITSPYFLPDNALTAALSSAALRGVIVDILVPLQSNLPFINLAAAAHYPALIRSGCRIHFGAPPFDHSKLAVIDDCWAMFGSSNWDARSLRLNFEFNIEAFGAKLPETLKPLLDAKFSEATLLPANWWKKQPLWRRISARLLWLTSPYL